MNASRDLSFFSLILQAVLDQLASPMSSADASPASNLSVDASSPASQFEDASTKNRRRNLTTENRAKKIVEFFKKNSNVGAETYNALRSEMGANPPSDARTFRNVLDLVLEYDSNLKLGSLRRRFEVSFVYRKDRMTVEEALADIGSKYADQYVTLTQPLILAKKSSPLTGAGTAKNSEEDAAAAEGLIVEYDQQAAEQERQREAVPHLADKKVRRTLYDADVEEVAISDESYQTLKALNLQKAKRSFSMETSIFYGYIRPVMVRLYMCHKFLVEVVHRFGGKQIFKAKELLEEMELQQ